MLSVLQCPACGARDWNIDRTRDLVWCARCRGAHHIDRGILVINVGEEHPEVVQERASVPGTEMTPALGGWKEVYTPETDPDSEFARAYLSLPYGNESAPFREPGYFKNVQRFAPEFDFILTHLPSRGLLLDVGADGTWSTAQLSRRGLTCIALDITDHLTLSHLFQTACPHYALINVDMHTPVFCDEAFDVITAFNAMHHSKRLDALAMNLGRSLKPGGVLGFVEPYVQNASQEAAFGAPQSAIGINENVHTVERWNRAFASAGLTLATYSLSDSFNAIYRRGTFPADSPRSDVLADYYAATLTVDRPGALMRCGSSQDFAVTVQSRGRAAWASRGPYPVRLSFHTSRVTSRGIEMVVFDNDRTLLQSFVCPGAPQTFCVPITLRDPGVYQLEFDLVHEGRCWFKERGGHTATARVEVVL